MPQPIPMPMSELCDRLTIARLKLARLTEAQADHDAIRRQIQHYIQGVDTNDRPLWLLLESLEEVNGRIWDAEHSIRKGLDAHVPLEEIGRRALLIRDINMQRIAIKNAIAAHTGQAEFTDVKMNYARDAERSTHAVPTSTHSI
jgi:hypothetical protein